MTLHSARLLLPPLSAEVVRRRLSEAEFEDSLDGQPLRFVPDWPGEALDFFPLIERGVMPADDHYVLVRAEDRLVIGLMGLKGDPNRKGEQEIGYGLIPQVWGQGYATEALGALLPHVLARPGVRRVTAETRLNNHASARVLHKCGFRQTGKRHSAAEGPLLLWTTLP